MSGRYPAASWRPLGPQTEPKIGTPRVLIFHTIVGYLKGTDTMFRRQGYQGTESHFGIGGPWDGTDLDGAVWQWQDITYQADAQNAGNAYATSIETSDGGDPNHPWSARQLNALVALTVWWCRETGNPPRLVTGATGSGIGYHAQFPAWAPDGRSCPGRVRIRQLLDYVIPHAASALRVPPMTGDDMPLTKEERKAIAEEVWAATFGTATGPVSAGARLAAVESTVRALALRPVVDVERLAAAVVAQLPASGTVTAASLADELAHRLKE